MPTTTKRLEFSLLIIGYLLSLSCYGLEQEIHPYREAKITTLAPERGFYTYQFQDKYGYPHYANIATDRSFDWVRRSGFSLVSSRVSLQEFREQPLSLSFLKDLEHGLAAVRSAKVKLILRFNYNNGNAPGPDASQDVILQHISQLKPLLLRNSDVIFALQAGFIGAWGEWHSSTHGLDTSAAQHVTIDALFQALPSDRFLQIRNPVHKRALLASLTGNASGEVGHYRNRIGFHIDCILASENDFTYPLDKIPLYNAYVEDESKEVPIGGETCRIFPPRTDCEEAQQTLKRQHFTYLNAQYEPAVIAHWHRSGCYESIKTHLGYSVRISSATFPPIIRANEVLMIALEIANAGWAAPIHNRLLNISMVSSNNETSTQTTALSASQFSPGLTKHIVEVSIGELRSPGRYSVYLSAPDPATRLEKIVEYSLPFANETYDERSGRVLLGSIEVLATE